MVFLLTLVSCRFKSDFLFFMDPYTWEALKSRSIEWKQLKSLLHDTGYRMRPVITEPGENSEALLTDTIKENKPGQGFIKAPDAGIKVVQEIDKLEDRAKARRILEKMKEDGVVITLLKTYTLNTFCLDFMQKEGGLAVIEDWTGFRVYEDVVLMSVEEDFIDTLKNLLNTRSESGPAGRRAASVKGTVRLKWGKAFDLPYEIKREADDGP